MRPERWAGSATFLLQLAVVAATLDRLAVNPLIKPIATGLHTSIGAAAGAATSYLLAYGLVQPVSGYLSDRFGRVPAMRWSLGVAAACSLLSAVAPDLPTLIAVRGLAGAAYAAVVPTAMVYVADTMEFTRRQRAIGGLLAASAVATALAVVGAGTVASLASWRLAFAVIGLGSAVMAVLTGRLPEPEGRHRGRGQVREVITRGWALYLILLAFPEGAIMFGFLNYFAPVLEARGTGPAIAGLTVSVYGLGVLGSIPWMRRLASTAPGPVLITLGGALTAAAYGLVAASQSIPAVLVASVGAGGGFTIMHSTVQTWVTEVSPRARGTAFAFFSCTLFLGGGAGTAVVAPLAGEGRFAQLFLIALAVSVPVTAVLALGRMLFHESPPLTAAGVEGTL